MKSKDFAPRILILAIAFSAVFATAAWAQEVTAAITGKITDPSGAAIAGAELNVVNPATNATAKAVSTATGEYNVPNLLPGVYRVEIAAAAVASAAAHLRHLSPQHVLDRGYSITETAAGTIVRDGSKLAPGEQLRITFAQGWAGAEVKERGNREG